MVQIFLSIVSVALIFVGINQITAGALHTFGSSDVLTPVENIYKIDDNIIDISK